MTFKYRVKELGRGKTVRRDWVHNLAAEADKCITELEAGNKRMAELIRGYDLNASWELYTKRITELETAIEKIWVVGCDNITGNPSDPFFEIFDIIKDSKAIHISEGGGEVSDD